MAKKTSPAKKKPVAARRSAPRTDPIKAEVVARHLIATAEEMAANLVRTAFSPNIKERNDCSTAIFDRRGQVIALANRIPMHLGSMVGAVEDILKRVPEEELRAGDMFMVNDPYNGGGSHLPDINLIAPVFFEKKLVAFVANIAHHADVGGMVPGSEAAVCQSIFQEGIRIPPVRIVRGGKLNQELLDILLLNTRTPDERVGDIRAQIASNPIGVRGVQTLFRRYGAADADATIAAYLDFTERRFRTAIEALPAGTYEAEDFMDGDAEGEVARIRVRLTIGKGRLAFDFSGSDPQIRSARNIPHRALLAVIYTVAKCLLDPDVPANAGYFRCIDVKAPDGTVIQPVPPAAVGARAMSCAIVGDVVAGALIQAMPDQALARCGPHHLVVTSGTDPRSGKYFVSYETVAGGMGARAHRDGMDGVRVHASGSSNLPIEALEHAYPMRVERYTFWRDSAGAGKHRGGMGVIREYRMLGENMVVSLSSERQHVAAQGLEGGAAGALGAFILDPDTERETKLPSAAGEVVVPKGSVLRLCTPGGGGYGAPAERDPSAVENDVRQGRTSADSAQKIYGWRASQ